MVYLLKSNQAKRRRLIGYNPIVPYLFVVPGMILFILIAVIPLFQTFILSFTDWNGVSQISSIKFNGLSNYIELFQRNELYIALKNNIIWAIASVTIPIVIGMVQANAIATSGIKYANLFQLLLFLPQILSSIIMSTMWSTIYNPIIGPINEFLKLVGLEQYASPWLGKPDTALYALLIMSIWAGYGFNTIVFTSAIRGINTSLFEAADMDGATSFQKFIYVTIPSIRKTTTTLLLFSLIGSFKVFDVVFQMTKGGPGYSTYVLSYFLYNEAFVQNNIGLGAAIAIVLTIFIFIISRLFLYFRKENDE
jgi:raffinose/stachyose/melibiose transport system permease protein